MVDFSQMKKNRGSNLDKLRDQVKKLNTAYEDSSDTRFWTPTVDKAGNGSAVLRFLPAPGDEDVPFVRIWEHFFKGPTGQYYVEKSLTTIGKDDPVGEFNSKLWSMSEDDNSPERKQARDQKRKLSYISNIQVIDDPAHPENNGKVFLYSYGKKIFDKIQDAMNSEDEDEPAFDPFDFYTGANFKLKIAKVDGFRNYDKSKFAAPEALSDDDKVLKAIWEKEYSLQEFLDPKSYKSYDELKKILDKVLGADMNYTSSTAKAAEVYEEKTPYTPPPKQKAKAPAYEEEEVVPTNFVEDEEDEDVKFFEQMNSED